MVVDRRLLLRCLPLATILLIAVSIQIGPAAASAPVIVSLVDSTVYPWSNLPTSIVITLTINYVPSTAGGYVDQAEVNFSGQTSTYPIDKAIQTTNPFQAKLETNTLIGQDYTVSARVHSTADGWSDWTATMPIPEFPMIPIVTFLTLVASLIVVRYGRRSQYSIALGH